MTLTRPAVGAPYDKRLTEAVLAQVLATPPRAFNSGADVDLFDAIEAFITSTVGTQVTAGIQQGATALTTANATYVTQVTALRDQTAALAADVQAALIDAAATLYAPQAVSLDGLTYALPDSQLLDAATPAALMAALTSSRLSSGSNSYDLTYTPRALTSPYDPINISPYISLGSTSIYRYGTTVNEFETQQQASVSLGASAGKTLRQTFTLAAPATFSALTLAWGQASGTDGYVVDSVYTIRLYDAGGTLLATWAGVNLRTLITTAKRTTHALNAEVTLSGGSVEIEVVSLAATTSVGGSSARYDVNFYPLVATIPVSEQGTRDPATLVGTGTITNASGEPVALAGPILPATSRPVQANVLTQEADGVRVQFRGQREHTNLPTLKRPTGNRRFVVIYTPQVREGLISTSLTPQVVHASLEQLQGGSTPSSLPLTTLTRQAGQTAFDLNGAGLPVGVRLRLEVLVDWPSGVNATRAVTATTYNDVTGVQLATAVGSLARANSDAEQVRLLLSPTRVNSNIHAADDLLIHRWAEWTD